MILDIEKLTSEQKTKLKLVAWEMYYADNAETPGVRLGHLHKALESLVELLFGVYDPVTEFRNSL